MRKNKLALFKLIEKFNEKIDVGEEMVGLRRE
jgi:hypothetical protein